MFKKNRKVGTDIPKVGNGMSQYLEAGCVSVWRGHTEP